MGNIYIQTLWKWLNRRDDNKLLSFIWKKGTKQQIYTSVRTQILNSSMLLYIDTTAQLFFIFIQTMFYSPFGHTSSIRDYLHFFYWTISSKETSNFGFIHLWRRIWLQHSKFSIILQRFEDVEISPLSIHKPPADLCQIYF